MLTELVFYVGAFIAIPENDRVEEEEAEGSHEKKVKRRGYSSDVLEGDVKESVEGIS